MTAISDAIDTVKDNVTGDLLSVVIGFCFLAILIIIAVNIFCHPADESNDKWQHLISVVAIAIILIVAFVTILMGLGYI